MALSAGMRLGPYEITGPLGAGGMGEVYRARDARLNRDVAIKTLPATFANDPARLARFEREAQVLAALNHPNIAAIYGLEEGALVMELVEGATLANRIAAGPIPPEEALGLARQIAEALEAAHEKNIIHRDLKPANIKITPDGKVKVLDFGLAKPFEAESAARAADLTNSPTRTLDPTHTGVILGTVGYMSPEQARGKPVDKRTDIWSFGVVLCEMLTGSATFEGETASDKLAAVLRADPDWKRLPVDTPPKVRRLLQRCLQRDLKRRLRDIGDAWLEMEAPDEPATAAAPAPNGAWRVAPWVLAGLLAIVGALGWLHTPPAIPRPVTRWSVPLPDVYVVTGSRLSRDGTRLAYAAGTANPRLMLRMMDQFEAAKPIPGGEGGYQPVFSPDGRWIVFTDQSKLKKMPVTGGTFTLLADGAQIFGTDWGDDDTIVFNAGVDKGLSRVSAAGGKPQVLTTPDRKKGEVSHRWPSFLPGAQAILFAVGTGGSWDTAHLAVLDLKTGERHDLASKGSAGRYVPTGHVVYVRGGTLFAAPFDLKRLALTGAEVPVVEGIASVNSVGFADYTIADSGLLVYTPGGQQQIASTLEWADRKGVLQPMAAPAQVYAGFRLSPDGERLAAVVAGADLALSDIWIYEFARGTLTRMTFEGFNANPVWTPDGRRIAFRSQRNGKNGIYWVPVDGSAQAELLLATNTIALPTSWTPDGKVLLFSQLDNDGKSHIWILPVPGTGGENKPREFLHTEFTETAAQVSPDGKWVAYHSNESGQTHVFVRPYPGPGGKIQVSTLPGSANPRWSRSGRELFYRESNSAQFWVVDVQPGTTFHAGQPQALFKQTGNFDVAPDGKRLLLVKAPPAGAGGASKVNAVVDWFEELRRRAPIKK